MMRWIMMDDDDDDDDEADDIEYAYRTGAAVFNLASVLFLYGL